MADTDLSSSSYFSRKAEDTGSSNDQSSLYTPTPPSVPVTDHTQPSAGTVSTPMIPTVGAIKDLIDGTPEIQDSLFSLFKATITAANVEEPKRLLREKDMEIEALKGKLAEATEYGIDHQSKARQLEAKIRTLNTQNHRLVTDKRELEAELRAAREFVNAKHAKVIELEADKQLLTNSGIEQFGILHDLQRENDKLKEKCAKARNGERPVEST